MALTNSTTRNDALSGLLALGRPLVMGILNLTPDSFSDGGQFADAAGAVAHARRMIDEGADIIDVGAESTRPYKGATPVAADEELARLAPAFARIVKLGVPVSIDSMKAEVAAWALDRGAAIANDVWGLQRDADMARVVAERGVPVIVMHNRASIDRSLDIMEDMRTFFDRSLAIAAQTGIARERIVLDPGIGFGKSTEQSTAAVARLRELRAYGLPILMGLSRKRFIASVSPSEPSQRIGGSIAGAVLSVLSGASIVRVHDVAETVQALRVVSAIEAARDG